jgi:hypothetical protein
MADKHQKPAIKIALTPEQQEQIKQATGKDVPSIELRPEDLEERVAPAGFRQLANPSG